MAAFDEQEYTKSFDIQISEAAALLLSPYKSLCGHVQRRLTFRYPDGAENVLEHFSLDVPRGHHTVAIVGETGAGKSHPGEDLACRFFEPCRARPHRLTRTTGSAASCGSTPTSAMCCRIPTCSPARPGEHPLRPPGRHRRKRLRPPPGPSPALTP